jgi:hypothetical protein
MGFLFLGRKRYNYRVLFIILQGNIYCDAPRNYFLLEAIPRKRTNP